jgi:hypothetical protein
MEERTELSHVDDVVCTTEIFTPGPRENRISKTGIPIDGM